MFPVFMIHALHPRPVQSRCRHGNGGQKQTGCCRDHDSSKAIMAYRLIHSLSIRVFAVLLLCFQSVQNIFHFRIQRLRHCHPFRLRHFSYFSVYKIISHISLSLNCSFARYNLDFTVPCLHSNILLISGIVHRS